MRHFLYGTGVMFLGFIFMIMTDNLIPGGTPLENAIEKVLFAILFLSTVVTVGFSQVIAILKSKKNKKE